MHPLVVSHRTNAGTHTENSLTGLEAAVAAGVHAVEFDVRATADGQLVLLHDPSLRRTTQDPRLVESVTLDQLRRVPLRGSAASSARETVPTLDEALERLWGRAVPVIDVKISIERELAAILEAHSELPVWCWTSRVEVAARLRQALAPSALVSLIIGPELVERFGASALLDQTRSLGLDGVVVEPELLSSLWVTAAEARRLQCHSGNVTTAAAAERAIRSGAGAICADAPSLVFEAISMVLSPGQRLEAEAAI